jgi:hypothetical protein
MRDDGPEYIVLRRRPPRRTGLIVGAVGVLGFAAGLACGLGFVLAVVLGFVAAGVTTAARRPRRRQRDHYDDEGW